MYHHVSPGKAKAGVKRKKPVVEDEDDLSEDERPKATKTRKGGVKQAKVAEEFIEKPLVIVGFTDFPKCVDTFQQEQWEHGLEGEEVTPLPRDLINLVAEYATEPVETKLETEIARNTKRAIFSGVSKKPPGPARSRGGNTCGREHFFPLSTVPRVFAYL